MPLQMRLRPSSDLPQLVTYLALKTALIKAFSKMQAQKDSELLFLSGLGDRKPLGLLWHTPPSTLTWRLCFMAQVPIEICQVLAGSTHTYLNEMATDAIALWRFPGLPHVLLESLASRNPKVLHLDRSTVLLPCQVWQGSLKVQSQELSV